MLAGMVAEAGCTVVDYGIVRDDEAELESVLRRAAADCDAIVTSGGVSMGDYDVVKAVLGRIAAMSWMQIAIKPAKPFAFGTLDGTPIFGLPGNPGQLPGQLRDARPTGAAQDGRPPTTRPSRGAGHRRRRLPRANPTARRTSCGPTADFARRRPPARAAGRRAGQPSAGRVGDRRRDRRPRPTARGHRRRRCRRLAVESVGLTHGPRNCDDRFAMTALASGAGISSIRSVASSRICGSRSPIGATSGARTACRRKGCSSSPDRR